MTWILDRRNRRQRRGLVVGLLLLAALYLAAVAGACRSRDDRAGPDLDAQVLQAIKAHEDQFFQAMRRGDVKAMVEVYTDDAISLAPGAPMVRGKAALEEFWTRYLQDASSVDVDSRHKSLHPLRGGRGGCVMGKMIDAQSIVVAGVATGQQGNEGEILRYVFWHSIALEGV